MFDDLIHDLSTNTYARFIMSAMLLLSGTFYFLLFESLLLLLLFLAVVSFTPISVYSLASNFEFILLYSF